MILYQFFKFVHKRSDVFEFTVNGSKTHISNLINVFKCIHYHVSDDVGGYFMTLIVVYGFFNASGH